MHARTKRIRLALGYVGAALAAGLSGAAASCGAEPLATGGASSTSSTASSSSASSSSSSSGSASSSSSGASSSSSSGSPVCNPKPLPAGVPDGWEEYTDWSCNCRFYVPASKQALPAPIAWEPCPENPGGIDCRQMKVDWPYLYKTPVALQTFLDWKPGQNPVLGFRRIATGAAQPYTLDMVADADGPTRNALMWQLVPGQPLADPGCAPRLDSMAQGMWVVGIKGDDAHGSLSASEHEGVIGGPIDQLHPPLLAHMVDDQAHEWIASAKWVGHADVPEDKLEIAPWPWSGQPVTFVASPAVDPEHLTIGNFVLRQDAIYWEATSLLRGGINVWTADKGARPFIRWLNDFTKQAGGFGTDGVDMVWAYGEKQAPSDPEFVGSIMTAPYTTEPDMVKAKRLRSFTSQIANYAWAVNCGYATNSFLNDTIVVRLSDGVSWMISSTANMTFGRPFGITCDEVFILGEYGGLLNIARVRLDSLGPGIAPD